MASQRHDVVVVDLTWSASSADESVAAAAAADEGWSTVTSHYSHCVSRHPSVTLTTQQHTTRSTTRWVASAFCVRQRITKAGLFTVQKSLPSSNQQCQNTEENSKQCLKQGQLSSFLDHLTVIPVKRRHTHYAGYPTTGATYRRICITLHQQSPSSSNLLRSGCMTIF